MKIKVGVLFGGKTTEHEVSIITAVQAMDYIDKEKYDVVPIYITKDNDWYTGEPLKDLEIYRDMDLLKRYCKNVVLYNDNGAFVLQSKKGLLKKIISEVDIIVPIVHGYNMEDGNIQGYLEMVGVPYTGSDIYGCVVGQDKVFQKQILIENGLSSPEYVWFYDNEYLEDEESVIRKIEKLGYPVIVKPARQGSSIGIKIAKAQETLKQAIKDAITYDDKILVEKVVENTMELNCSVLGSTNFQETSAIEQVKGKDEILSFNDKYIGAGAKKGSLKTKTGALKGMVTDQRVVPAEIPLELKNEIEETSKKAFRVLGANGVIRIDYLYDKKAKKLYINELNTIPGCLSFYLWMPIGKNYDTLIDDMISIAIKRYKKKMKKVYKFDSNILAANTGLSGLKGMKGKIRKQ